MSSKPCERRIAATPAGSKVPDGFGSITGTIDQNGQSLLSEGMRGDPSIVNQDFLGSYLVDADGRSTMTLQVSSDNTYHAIAYLYAPNEGFLMKTSETDFARGEVAAGTFKPQLSGPFAAGLLSGTFRTNTVAPRPDWSADSYSGLTIFDGAGAVASSLDVAQNFSGTYVVSANGRSTLALASASLNEPVVLWIISPTELVGIFPAEATWYPVLLIYEK